MWFLIARGLTIAGMWCQCILWHYVRQPIKIYLQNYKWDEILEVFTKLKNDLRPKTRILERWKEERKGCEGGQSDNHISVGKGEKTKKPSEEKCATLRKQQWWNQVSSTWACIVPVIQNKNNLSTFKGELIVLHSFKVIQGSHLPQARGVLGHFCSWVQGFGFHLLLFLLLQRQFNSCRRGREEKNKFVGFKSSLM